MQNLAGAFCASISAGPTIQTSTTSASSARPTGLHFACRIRHSLGKRPDAHDLLSSVYDWFTEGFETADLKEAKALLEGLQ